MKKQKFLMSKIRFSIISLFIGVALVAGSAFAWNAVWHGTDWIKNGGVIKAKEIAENFEYLYGKIKKIPEPLNCKDGDIITWKDGEMICSNPDSNTDKPGAIVAGCGIKGQLVNRWGKEMVAFPKTYIGGWGGSTFRYINFSCWGGAKPFTPYAYDYGNTIYASSGGCPAGTSIYALSSVIPNCDIISGDGGTEGSGSDSLRCSYYPPESFVCIKD